MQTPNSSERHGQYRLSLGAGAISTSQATAAQTGAANTKISSLDALIILDAHDEVALAVGALAVLVGEPGIGEGVSPDGLDVGGDGGITG